jgi:polyphosphate glucokinase
MDVLVIDIGGSHVKLFASSAAEPRGFDSHPGLTPQETIERALEATRDWRFDAVSLGYPGLTDADGPLKEPGNLGPGWIGFDFAGRIGKPVRVINDAVMQALGGYEGGRMLFLGLGTGLGSALVSDHVIVPLELGDLPTHAGDTFGERLGREGVERLPFDAWMAALQDAVETLRPAFAADYVLLGGGNAQRVEKLPDHTRRADPDAAFVGGLRLWEEPIEPHDRSPRLAWRVVR